MKKLVVGFLVGLLAFPALCDVINGIDWFVDSDATRYLSLKTMVPSYGLQGPFIQNCTLDKSKNGHGWIFVNREYYNCGRVAITISDLIYGERTRPIVVPKFKVGDCIKSYGTFEGKIIEVLEDQYGYTVGANCKGMLDCSTSVGDIDTTDENSVLMKCPK